MRESRAPNRSQQNSPRANSSSSQASSETSSSPVVLVQPLENGELSTHIFSFQKT